MSIYDFKCKYCGGALESFEGSATVGKCVYCGSRQTLPRLLNEKNASLFERANRFRRNNEFDKAEVLYEQILNEDSTDPEAYWSLVLCRYGIEYVEDSRTKKRIPTVNRLQYNSILADEDYKSALKYASPEQQEIYSSEAEIINEIQKSILEIAEKEEPFDVFICYKESDECGNRTKDSYLAQELYHELTRDGYKAFFAKETLRGKLGSAYEPYIFSALNSSKVMIVLGTKSEYFESVWVRNEWSRYLSLIKNGEKKVLIPAYRDMDAYGLPVEFSHLQALDMSRLGFMQDLVDAIEKIISQKKKNAPLTSKVKTKTSSKKKRSLWSVILILVFAMIISIIAMVINLQHSNTDLESESKTEDTIQATKNEKTTADETTVEESLLGESSVEENSTEESSDYSKGLAFTEGAGSCILTGLGTCTDFDIIVPSSYNGMPVSGIGANAFEDCLTLVSITLPNSITNIGMRAFRGCENLESITMSDNVTSIGMGAFVNCTSLEEISISKNLSSIKGSVFEGCTSLEKIIIPNGVTSIEHSAFHYCTSLTSITIPSSVTSIKGTFIGCTSLTNITVDKNNTVYKSINGNLYSKDGKELIRYAEGKTDSIFAIPDGVTIIGNAAFYDCLNLTRINITSDVTNIDANAFFACENLTSITIPSSVTSIGSNAFWRCRTLKIYYSGTNEQWDDIDVSDLGNDVLTYSEIIYNYVP